jgi:exopolysaccharide biosynthesis polyprenyl glycosylphosphotransferase
MPKRYRRLIFPVLLDVLLVNLAFALAYYVRYQLELLVPVSDAFYAPYATYLSTQFWYTVLMLFFLFLDGVYSPRRGGSWFNELYRVANATTTVGIIEFAITFFLQPAGYSRGLILEAVVLTIVLLSGARLIQRLVQAQLRRRGHGVDRVLIVGAGDAGRAVMRSLVALPQLGYQVVGFVDDDPAKGDIGRFKALGQLDNLPALLKSERVDEVIITLPWMYQRQIISLVRACEAHHVRARVVPDLFQLALNQVDLVDIGGIPLIGIKEATISRTGRMVKRALDIGLSLLVLLAAAPLMLFIALMVKLSSPGPVFFRQTRIGEKGRPFSCIKFRTMHQGAEAEQQKLQALNEADGPLFKIKDDPRLTPVGKYLRRSSMDELPQFFNILRGEMSIIGPRPALIEEVAQYQAWHCQRLDVPQGLSGLWQVSGRSDLTFDEMCLLDIYYIENWSVGLDLTIMLRTIPRVLFGSGAY